MMACPHFPQGTVDSGGRSPGMNTLLSQLLQVTIFKGALMSQIQPSIDCSRRELLSNSFQNRLERAGCAGKPLCM